MEKRTKIIIGTIGGAAIVGGIIFLPNLIRTSNASPELDTVPRVMVHKVDLTGITLRLDVQIKNPTKADFKMKYPYFRVLFKGETIGTSQSVNQDIAMPHLGETNINSVMIRIPLFNALSVIGTLLKAIQGSQGVELEVVTKTHIDPYWTYNDSTQQWKRKLNFGNASLIEVTKKQTVNLIKQKA